MFFSAGEIRVFASPPLLPVDDGCSGDSELLPCPISGSSSSIRTSNSGNDDEEINDRNARDGIFTRQKKNWGAARMLCLG